MPGPAEVSPALTQAVNKLYSPQTELSYFAGGHKWSDGTLYQFTRDGQSYILKLMLATDAGKTDAMEERLRYQEYLGLAGIDIVCPIQAYLETFKGHILTGLRYLSFDIRDLIDK